MLCILIIGGGGCNNGMSLQVDVCWFLLQPYCGHNHTSFDWNYVW